MVDARDQQTSSEVPRMRRRLVLGAALLAAIAAIVSLWLPWWWVDVELEGTTSTILGRSLPDIASRSSVGRELGIEAPSAWALLTLVGVGALAAVAGSRTWRRLVAAAALVAGLGAVGTAAIAGTRGDPTLDAMADRRIAQLTDGRLAGRDDLAERVGALLGSAGFETSLRAEPGIGLGVAGGAGIALFAAGLLAVTASVRNAERAR